MTKKEIIEELERLEIEFDPKSKKDELLLLLPVEEEENEPAEEEEDEPVEEEEDEPVEDEEVGEDEPVEDEEDEPVEKPKGKKNEFAGKEVISEYSEVINGIKRKIKILKGGEHVLV